MSFNLPKLSLIEAPIPCQLDRLKPVFCFAFGGLNVNVYWFSVLVGIKEKSICANTKDGWHPPYPPTRDSAVRAIEKELFRHSAIS